MKLNDITTVAFRVIAVYLAVQLLLQTSASAWFFINLNGHDAGKEYLMVWVALGSAAAVTLLLWILAKRLANLATRHLSDENISIPGNVTAQAVQRVALALIGVWLLVTSLPSLAVQVIDVVRLPEMDRSRIEQFWNSGIYNALRLIVGFLLILGAGFWAALLVRLQGFGLRSKSCE